MYLQTLYQSKEIPVSIHASSLTVIFHVWNNKTLKDKLLPKLFFFNLDKLKPT